MNTILGSVFFLISFSVIAQDFPKTEYLQSDVTWYGIDYTRIHMIGADDFNDPQKIVDVYFDAWNEFVKSEPKKYDIPLTLMKLNAEIELDQVSSMNAGYDYTQIPHIETTSLSENDLREVVSGYVFSGDGLGVMLIAENYNKNKVRGSYHFVLFRESNNEIIFSKLYEAKARGFGFRNYWARTFYGTLGMIRKDLKRWSK